MNGKIICDCSYYLYLLPYFHTMNPNLFENTVRKGILSYVTVHPGHNISDVSRTSNVSRNTVIYHIKKLVASGDIVSFKIGKFTRLFSGTHDSDVNSNIEKAVISCTSNETGKQILLNIMDNPSITNQKLAEKFNLKKSTIHWYIKGFLKYNLIISKSEGRFKKYYMTQETEKILRKYF